MKNKEMYKVWYYDTDGSYREAYFETKSLAGMVLEKMKIDGLKCGMDSQKYMIEADKGV